MSDTPRTDEQAVEAITGLGTCVGVNFARQLERDLIDAEEKIVELEEELDLHAHQLNPAIVQARNDQLAKELAGANARADKLEESLRIIGDMAVVDWDDAVVDLADKSVSDKLIPSTYADRVRKLYKDAEMCEVWRARCKEAQYALAQALVPGEFCKAAMERVISARDAGKDE